MLNYIKIFLLFIFAASLLFAQEETTSADTVFSVDTVTVVVYDTVKAEQESPEKTIAETIENPPVISEIISISKVFWSIVFVLIGFYVIRIITKILDLFAEKSTSYRLTIKGVIPVVRIFGWIIIVYIVVAGIFQPPQATLLAAAASLGIAIGFASQDIFKNIFGGIMILFDRPFQVGDKIAIGDHYGEVVKIGLRSTRIVTPDDSLVTVPNGDVMSQQVSNSNSGEPNCQVVSEIYLPITINTEQVRQIATEAAQTSRYIYLNKPITILFFNEVKQRRSFYKMRVKAYVMDIRYEFNFKSDMTEIVIRELLKNNIISSSDLF